MFEIIKHGKCYSVVNVKTNKVHSRCSNLKNAKKQKRLLLAIEHGFKFHQRRNAVPKELKPSGDGLKRKVGLYSPSMRQLLSQVGSETITSLKVVRTPIEKAIKTLLNVISLGAYEKAVKQSGYDQMFHLALLINDKYQLDKQAVVTMAIKNPITPKSEVKEVPNIPVNLNIQTLVDSTKAFMGDAKFSNYDAHTNNCQDFLLAVLQSNGLLNEDLRTFIKQDADVIFKNIPQVSEKIAKVFTDVGAVADKVVQGEGQKNKNNSPNNKMPRKPSAWIVHVKKVMSQHKGKPLKQILKLAKESYKR